MTHASLGSDALPVVLCDPSPHSCAAHRTAAEERHRPTLSLIWGGAPLPKAESTTPVFRRDENIGRKNGRDANVGNVDELRNT